MREFKKRKLCILTIIIILIILGLHFLGVSLFDYKGKQDLQNTDILIISEETKKEYTYLYKGIIKNQKFLIYIPQKYEKLKIGDIIKIDGKFNEPSGKRNYKGFDYKLYLKTKKISGSIKVENVKKEGNLLKEKIKNKKYRKYKIYCIIEEFFKNLRNKISKVYDKNLNKDNSSILKALTIGEKEELDIDTKEMFREASLSHVLAISGAHFSYIILAISYAQKMVKRKRSTQILSIFAILFFIFLTGKTPSVLRAGIMGIVIIIASMSKRQYDFLNSLCISLLIQIFLNPYVIFDIGLKLSYGGVLGIVYFYNIVQKIIKSKILSVSISANLVIFPIMMYEFNTVQTSFLVSNFLVSFILGPIIIIGYLSFIFHFKIIFWILNLMLDLFYKNAYFSSKIPFATIYITKPNILAIIFYYVLLIVVYYFYNKRIEKTKFKKIFITLVILIFISNLNYSKIINTFDGNLLINFIDVSQGDCCLLRNKGKVMMIDSGGETYKKESSNYSIGKNVDLPYLLSRKITKIDYCVISHFDSDHAQGFVDILENLKVKNLIIAKQKEECDLYKKIIKICKKKKINIIYVKKGDEFNFGKAKVKILYPEKEFENYIDKNVMNNNAICMKVIYNKTSILFTGDIEKEAEEKIVDSNQNLKSDILKVAHHGSRTSTTDEFLEKVNPKICLIGVGINNKFKHPSKSTIEKLDNKNIKIYRTDLNGEITIKIKNTSNVKISTMHSKNKETKILK